MTTPKFGDVFVFETSARRSCVVACLGDSRIAEGCVGFDCVVLLDEDGDYVPGSVIWTTLSSDYGWIRLFG